MKRFLLFLSALMLSIAALWAHDVQVDGIYYNLDEIKKTAIVTYSGNYYDSVHDEYSGSVTIPETITYNSEIYSVTSIGDYAFYGCSGLTSLTIGNSITSIGSAFYNCSGLTKVNYLGTVDKWVEIDFENFNSKPTYYANDLYINNELLTDVKITTANSIKDYAFYNCQSIKSVEIGESVTSIGSSAFSICSGLTEVTIGNSVTSIGRYAFHKSSGLTSVTIGNSVTFIGGGAFNNTGIYYSESNWDNGVLYIDNCLIEAKSDVVKGSYTIKEGTRVIGSSAFYNCSGLTEVTIPNSVTSIGHEAFNGCSGLTSVTIPNSVTSIGGNAFSDCSGLTSVTIPNSVTFIAPFAFEGCSGLTSVVWNAKNCEDFKNYNETPFNNIRSSITSFTFGNEVEHIPAYLCRHMENLKEVTIGNSVTSIGYRAFSDCSGLTSVTIPNSVTSIDSYTFNGCSGLTEILVSSNNDEFSSENGVLYNNDKTTLIIYPEGKKDTSFTIPNSVTSIGSYAFRGCSGLTSVTIPNSVISIGSSAFSGCDSLKTVYNCSNLEIKKGNEDHGYVAYYADKVINACPIGDFIVNYEDEIIEYIGDTTVNKIEIPEFVKGIEADVFAHCKNLNKITILSNEVPNAYISSFAHYNAYLYVPCDVHEDYDLDYVFGNFKYIKCIAAEEVEGSDKVEIEVDSNNNATIIWPSTGNASSYELVISKNGEVFCTLLFNENGQLTSIDFGNRSASVGFQFTVTGLDAASKYSYSIVAKDEKGNELESYNGTFTTNGYSEVTAILETLADANITISGGLITCSDAEFTIYNTLGQDVTAYNGSLQPGIYVVALGEDRVKVMVK